MNSLCDLLEKNYPRFGRVIEISQVDAHEINSKNYIVKFNDSPKKFLFKLLFEGQERTERVLSLIMHCRKKGCKVPQIIETDSLEIFVETDEGHAYLQKFFEGGQLDGSDRELEDLAAEIAKLHLAMARYTGGLPKHKKSGLYAHLSDYELDEVEAKIREKSRVEKFDLCVLESLPKIREAYSKNKDFSRKVGKKEIPKQPIHYDLTVDNSIFQNGKLQCILDFDSARIGERVRDVAFACFRYSFYGGADPAEAKKRTDKFLASYCSTNPLGKDESDAVAQYYVDECLNRVSYILRDNYFNKNPEWNFELEKHLGGIIMVQRMEEIK